MNYDEDLDEELDYLERQRREYAKFLAEDAIKLELGKTYLQMSAVWTKAHYKIVLINDDVAVGQRVYCGIYNSTTKGCGDYAMFKTATGEKYGDGRLCYRLRKEID
jgi:hypothetical protein